MLLQLILEFSFEILHSIQLHKKQSPTPDWRLFLFYLTLLILIYPYLIQVLYAAQALSLSYILITIPFVPIYQTYIFISLNNLTCSFMAISVGILSMLDAPKNPTTPSVLSSTYAASSGIAIGPP